MSFNTPLLKYMYFVNLGFSKVKAQTTVSPVQLYTPYNHQSHKRSSFVLSLSSLNNFLLE